MDGCLDPGHHGQTPFRERGAESNILTIVRLTSPLAEDGMASPTFYVASPLGDRTAGPEALTQLVDAIRRRDVNAYLIPMYNFRGRRNDPEYDLYDFEVAERIPKTDDSYFVMTEVSPIESFRELRTVPPSERGSPGSASTSLPIHVLGISGPANSAAPHSHRRCTQKPL